MNNGKLLKYALCFQSVLMVFPVEAEEIETERAILGFGNKQLKEEMQTDRPDFTGGTRTVEVGHIQFEFGPLYTYDDSKREGISQSVATENLLRIGLTDDVEGRVEWSGEIYSKEPGRERSFDQLSDFSLGVKWRLYEEHLSELPAFSLVTEMGLPLDRSDGLSDRVEPRVKLILSNDFTGFVVPLTFSGNFNWSYVNTNKEEYPEFASSFSVGFPIVGDLEMFHEYFGIFPVSNQATRPENYFNSGFTYGYTPNIQFDIRVGAGLNEAADDLYSGLGISVRL